MLDDVIGNYIDSLTEREFDAPFMALLRLHGFFDIHFRHGSFEFGKDFIAKRVEDGKPYQYTFQTRRETSGWPNGTYAEAKSICFAPIRCPTRISTRKCRAPPGS